MKIQIHWIICMVLFLGISHIDAQKHLKGCNASLENDVLTVSNNQLEAQFIWNNGDIINKSIRQLNGKAHIQFQTSASSGFVLPGCKGNPTDGKLNVTKVKGNFFYNDHLMVEVMTSFKNMELKRIMRVYPDAPAIFTEYYCRSRGEMSAKSENCSYMNKLALDGSNWTLKAVRFKGQSDGVNNLMYEQEVMTYYRIPLKGNLLTVKNRLTDQGFFLYKKAPLQEAYSGYCGNDFEAHRSRIDVMGVGFTANDLKQDEWTKGYSLALGIAASAKEYDVLTALRQAQVAESDYESANDMVLMNTWGDRSKDGRLSEKFIMNELDKCQDLGVTHYQLDDGWQAGLSHNSAFKGKNKAWEKWAVEDWLPHPERFPNGLEPIVKKAKRLNIQIGLWFNPSSHNDYEAWENDANILIGLYKRYGIRIFKIDGMQINNKKGEEQFLKFYSKVIKETDGNVFFNLDVTAGKRFGYHFLHANHNVFLENRYTDSRSYFPFRTLRNMWMLSKYVPAQHLQIEFLNKWRNAAKYGDDPLAPAQVPFDYCFAVTCMAQPLAWFEASGLPKEAFPTAKLIKQYNAVRNDIHKGMILPVGNCPDGLSWTGFQSILDDTSGYLMVYRELTGEESGVIESWLTPGQTIKLTKVFGEGEEQMTQTVQRDGGIEVKLPHDHSFVLYRYKVN